MTKSIREVLSPLLILSYMCGMRIFEFPTGHSRPWFSFLYISLLWPIYCFFVVNVMLHYIPHDWHNYVYCIWLNILTALLSIPIRIYHDKKFRISMKKIAIVDETLGELGTAIDYQKLNRKTMKVAMGWVLSYLSMTFFDILWWIDIYDTVKVFYIPFLINYCAYINCIDDLVFASTLDYIGSKFDQINNCLRQLTDGKFIGRKYRIKRAWKNIVARSHQHELLGDPGSEFVTWIVIHLHVELCKICQEINSIFDIQLTAKMACYFCFLAEIFFEIFEVLSRNIISHKQIYYTFTLLLWFSFYIYRLLLVNYMCETISAKANIIICSINKVPQSTFNIEIRENIAQLSLHTIRTPLKFRGLGLFQFGFEFLRSYVNSILTLLVIVIQTSKYKYEFLKKYF